VSADPTHADVLPAAVLAVGEVVVDDDLSCDVEEHARFPFRRRTATTLEEIQIDAVELRRSLDGLTATLTRVLADQDGQLQEGFRLESFTVGLTLSATGKLLMIAEAGLAASIELTFSRST
jgi:hypothetical protein